MMRKLGAATGGSCLPLSRRRESPAPRTQGAGVTQMVQRCIEQKEHQIQRMRARMPELAARKLEAVRALGDEDPWWGELRRFEPPVAA